MKSILLHAEIESEECDVVITVIVTKDLEAAQVAQIEWAKAHRTSPYEGDFGALSCSVNHHFLMVFRNDFLNHRAIFHEVFHCTHRVYEFLGDKFSRNHHEPYATFQGWLGEKLHKEFKKAKLQIKE